MTVENGNAMRTEWHDAATPTVAARADAIVKLTGGKPVLSVEGAWDEMGWSEPRKAREREYLAAERRDPQLDDLADRLISHGWDFNGASAGRQRAGQIRAVS